MSARAWCTRTRCIVARWHGQSLWLCLSADSHCGQLSFETYSLCFYFCFSDFWIVLCFGWLWLELLGHTLFADHCYNLWDSTNLKGTIFAIPSSKRPIFFANKFDSGCVCVWVRARDLWRFMRSSGFLTGYFIYIYIYMSWVIFEWFCLLFMFYQLKLWKMYVFFLFNRSLVCFIFRSIKYLKFL